jgi:hypothetical protein
MVFSYLWSRVESSFDIASGGSKDKLIRGFTGGTESLINCVGKCTHDLLQNMTKGNCSSAYM